MIQTRYDYHTARFMYGLRMTREGAAADLGNSKHGSAFR